MGGCKGNRWPEVLWERYAFGRCLPGQRTLDWLNVIVVKGSGHSQLGRGELDPFLAVDSLSDSATPPIHIHRRRIDT